MFKGEKSLSAEINGQKLDNVQKERLIVTLKVSRKEKIKIQGKR